jgi:hypothetical protein
MIDRVTKLSRNVEQLKNYKAASKLQIQDPQETPAHAPLTLREIMSSAATHNVARKT